MSALRRALPFFTSAIVLCTASPQFRTFTCPEEGRFQHPTDCTSHYACISSYNGSGIVAQPSQPCLEGQAFSPEERNCLPIEKVEDCKVSQRTPRHSMVGTLNQGGRLPHLDHLCTSHAGFKCGTCKQLINCANSMAYLAELCPIDKTCQVTAAFPGGACLLRDGDTTACKCDPTMTGTPKQFADEYNTPNGFITCPAGGADPRLHHCPEGTSLEFDSQASEVAKCVGDSDHQVCTTEGSFPNNNDCQKYTHCTSAADGLVMIYKTCPTNMWLNRETQHCEDPCSWGTPIGIYECTAQGFFADEYDCSVYHKCLDYDNDGVYDMTTLQCAAGQHFDQSAGQCVNIANTACTATQAPTSPCGTPSFCSG